MTRDDIQKEWDAFIEYPDGSGKLYVTTTSALLFAKLIAEMSAAAEREACASMVDHILKEGGGTYGKAIRARGET